MLFRSGIYGYLPKVNYFFSIPTAVKPGAIEMDLFNISTDTKALDAAKQKRYDYLVTMGTFSSALEHEIPEQTFVLVKNAGEAISAVKVLEKASLSGQRIYQITPDNQAVILPNLNHSPQVMREISDALNAGKNVITHTNSILISGWEGSGYIILDPEVGDGAYKISGGRNGSYLDDYAGISGSISIALFAVAILAAVASGPLLPLLLLIITVISLFHIFITTLIADLELKKNKCPEAFSYILFGTSVIFAMLPKVFNDKLRNIALSMYSFITKNALTAAAPACGGA